MKKITIIFCCWTTVFLAFALAFTLIWGGTNDLFPYFLSYIWLFGGIITLINAIALFFSNLSLTFSLNSRFLNTLVKILMFIPELTRSLLVVLKGIFIPFSLLFLWIAIPLILLFFIKVYIGDFLTEELILFLSLTIGTITLVSFGDKWITKYLSSFNTSKTLGLFQEYEIAKIVFKKYLHQNRLKLYIFISYFFLIITSASIELGDLEYAIYGNLIDLDFIIYSLAAFIAFDRITSSKHLLEKPDEVKSLSS